ncbi:hypothetical protein R70723_28425 [Paenibacillus sp. FSL R7-0273]|uniref:hypothetical protein n=1 Tax=Paenibacillus sp. FSL R7-0273 TaxID=1536772 RepID=UPI0004F62BF9|nr:hypothetical protein [Paenibacillus sp. FSL R7-0273]AIQ49372.1 hypothetical protein R70723_28425 [Paenibacillus sp. FSL R7-0273]OMF85321.1 hypothetical protein BK144_28270 [Paenibacillus sp. FSL R7-0273]
MKNDIIDLYDYSNLSEADFKAESIEGPAFYQPRAKEKPAVRETPGNLCFWGFPGGRGRYQPWRRRLWELQNNLDRE